MEGAIGSFDAFHSLLEKQQQQFQQEEPQFQFVNMFGQIVTPSSSYQQQQFSRPHAPPIQHTQIARLSATKPQVPSPLTSVTHPESPYSGESSPPTPHNIRLNSTPSEPSTTIHRPHSKLSISTSSTNSHTHPTTTLHHNPASQTSPKPPPFWPAPRKSTSNQLTASALSTSHTTQNQQQPPLHPHHATPAATTGSQQHTIRCPITDCKKSFKLQDSLTSHMIAAHNMSVPGVVSTSGSLGVGLPGLVQAGGAPLVASVAEVHGHGAEQGGSGGIPGVPPKLALKCNHPGCDQTFSRSHDLKRHSYTHSTARPFSCKRCGKGFARRDVLRRHEQAWEEGKRVNCVPLGSSGGEGTSNGVGGSGSGNSGVGSKRGFDEINEDEGLEDGDGAYPNQVW